MFRLSDQSVHFFLPSCFMFFKLRAASKLGKRSYFPSLPASSAESPLAGLNVSRSWGLCLGYFVSVSDVYLDTSSTPQPQPFLTWRRRWKSLLHPSISLVLHTSELPPPSHLFPDTLDYLTFSSSLSYMHLKSFLLLAGQLIYTGSLDSFSRVFFFFLKNFSCGVISR